MFEGFTLSNIDTGEVVIRVRHGGSGRAQRLRSRSRRFFLRLKADS